LAGDALRIGERRYTLTQHGFARDLQFRWLETSANSCALELTKCATTLASYPFTFRLVIRYAVEDATLSVAYEVTNSGPGLLPASVGAHPAFRWPLHPATPPDEHRIEFDEDLPDPVYRLAGGLLRTSPAPSPVCCATLPLSRALFAKDALILRALRSKTVRYIAPGGPSLAISWTGFSSLGLWSRAGGDFLCIEPWYGHSDPEDFVGDFTEKPGVRLVAPGELWSLSWTVAVQTP
jgi:galactose mutarotase-like enzyme